MLWALRRLMLAVVSTPGVRTAPAIVDALPAPGDGIRHFWLRISSGGGDGGAAATPTAASEAPGASMGTPPPHFNTNGNLSSEPAESAWHIDNPGRPTLHRTSRLILKLYSAESKGRGCGGASGVQRGESRGERSARESGQSPSGGRAAEEGLGLSAADDVAHVSAHASAHAPSFLHVLQLRAPELSLFAEVAIRPGDGVLMSDVARGSSVWGVTPRPVAEHRGRTPHGKWQVEILLTLMCEDVGALHASLEAVATELRNACADLGPTLADGAPLDVDPSAFCNHPAVAGSKEEAMAHYRQVAHSRQQLDRREPPAREQCTPVYNKP